LKAEAVKFEGFRPGLFKFLKDLEKKNSVEWFHANDERYRTFLVGPAKAFISELAPFLNHLNPAIRTEPKFNQTIMRLNKDMRFAKGEPYRASLLIHFGKFKLDSEFYIYFEPGSYSMGLFINRSDEEGHFFRRNQVRYAGEIKEICARYKIDNNYSLSYLGKKPTKLIPKFSGAKNYDSLDASDHLLFEKIKLPPEKVLFSDEIIGEMMKMISLLYPLYCFAISPKPLKELARFEDNFGEQV
jgi:Conserved hypothetical protein (DUF2461)